MFLNVSADANLESLYCPQLFKQILLRKTTVSSYSWGPVFCFPLHLRDSHRVSRHLHFFLYFCSLYALASCGKEVEQSQSSREICVQLLGDSSFAALQVLPEPALQAQGAQNHGRLGTQWDAVLEYPKQEEMQVTASQSSAPRWRWMRHVLWYGRCDLWEEVSILLVGRDIFQLPGTVSEFQALTETFVPVFSVQLSMSRKQRQKWEVNLS